MSIYLFKKKTKKTLYFIVCVQYVLWVQVLYFVKKFMLPFHSKAFYICKHFSSHYHNFLTLKSQNPSLSKRHGQV